MDGWSKAVLQEAPVRVTEKAWPFSPGILSTIGPDWPGIPAGRSSTPAARLTSRSRRQEKKKESIEEAPGELQEKPQASGSFSEPTAFWPLVQEGSGRSAKGTQGSLRTSPPSQGLEVGTRPSSS